MSSNDDIEKPTGSCEALDLDQNWQVVSGNYVQNLAYCQLSIPEIAAILECTPQDVYPRFAKQYREGVNSGQAALIAALFRNAVLHNDRHAQLFLNDAVVGMPGHEAKWAAKRAQERQQQLDLKIALMTREQLKQRCAELKEKIEKRWLERCETDGIDSLDPEVMEEIRWDLANPEAARERGESEDGMYPEDWYADNA